MSAVLWYSVLNFQNRNSPFLYPHPVKAVCGENLLNLSKESELNIILKSREPVIVTQIVPHT